MYATRLIQVLVAVVSILCVVQATWWDVQKVHHRGLIKRANPLPDLNARDSTSTSGPDDSNSNSTPTSPPPSPPPTSSAPPPDSSSDGSSSTSSSPSSTPTSDAPPSSSASPGGDSSSAPASNTASSTTAGSGSSGSSTTPSASSPTTTPPPSNTSSGGSSDNNTNGNTNTNGGGGSSSSSSSSNGDSDSGSDKSGGSKTTAGGDDNNAAAASTTAPPVKTEVDYITKTLANGSKTVETSLTRTTETAGLNGQSSKASGMTVQTRNTIIGVVVGVGGAVILGALALVAFRVWGRKRHAEEADGLMAYDVDISAAEKSPRGSSAGGGPRNPFQSTLENYHQPVNASANF